MGLTQLTATVLVLAAVLSGAASGPWPQQAAVHLHGLVLESFPWLLLGAVAAAAAEELLPDRTLPDLARRLGRWAVPGTALAAPLVPMCECGIVAVVRGLLAKGLPAHLGITFLLAAPILNPIVLATTWFAFQDWRLVALRAGCGLAIACTAGVLAARVGADRLLARPPAPMPPALPRISIAGARPATVPVAAATAGAGRAPTPPRGDRVEAIARRTLTHALDIAAVFVLGAILAATARTAIPPEALQAVGGHALAGPAAGACLAIGLSVCAETDAFLAASFVGMAPAAILCFLVVGPLLDLKLLLMYRGLFTTRTILCLAGGIPAAAWLLCVAAGAAW